MDTQTALFPVTCPLSCTPGFFYKSPPPALVRQTRKAGWASSRRHKPGQVQARDSIRLFSHIRWFKRPASLMQFT